MAQETKVNADRAKTWPFVLPNLPATLQLQTQAWLEEQAELMEATQKMMAAWTKRRQEAIEASFRMIQSLYGCKDFGDAASLYSEWLGDSMKRVVADINEARDEALRLIEIGQKSLAAVSPKGLDGKQSATDMPLRKAAE